MGKIDVDLPKTVTKYAGGTKMGFDEKNLQYLRNHYFYYFWLK